MDLLNDEECTTRLKRCCKKLVKKSTEAIHPSCTMEQTTTNTEIRCHSLDAPSRYNAVWQNCLGESFIRRDKSWENSKFDTLDSQIESRRCSTAARSTTWFCSTNILQRLNKTFEPFLNKWDSEKDKRLREVKNMTVQSTLAQDGGSLKSCGETCRQLRPRQNWGRTIGRWAGRIPSILHGLTIREIFSQSEDRFRLHGEKLPDNRREV